MISFLTPFENMQKPYTQDVSPSVFEAALENALDAIAILNAIQDEQGEIIDFKYAFLNKASEVLVDREYIRGKRMLEVYPQHSETGLFELYKRVFISKKAETRELYIEEPKNSWANIKISPTEKGSNSLLY